MKFRISDLEKKLNCKIKRNYRSVGFDTATKTGVGIITVNKQYAIIDWILIEFDAKNINEIYKQMYWEFSALLDKNFNCCVIENVYIGQNPDTSIKLARFGGFAIARAIENNIHFETIGATSARSKLGINTRKYKGKPKKAVRQWLKETLNLDLDEDNCADGIVLALLGIIKGMDFRSQKEIKAERKRNKK